MKKLTTLLKTLLVVLCLGGGGNVWASETTTLSDFDAQKTPFVISDANRLGVSYNPYVAEGTDYYATYRCGNMNSVAFAYYDFSSLVADASKVKVEFDFNIATRFEVSSVYGECECFSWTKMESCIIVGSC